MQCEIQDTGGNWHSITGMIAAQGWKVSRNDVDGANAGRNMLGNMIRDRVAIKTRIDVKLRAITKAEKDQINVWLNPTSFYMRYKDDADVSWTTLLVYSNNYSWQYCVKQANGEEYYFNFGFPFIEI